jgi:two-component system, sensor histidine kinase LadS
MRASHAPASKQPKVTHTIMRWLWPILLLLMPLPALAGNQATLFESAVEIGQTDRTLALSEHLLYRADPDRALTAPLIAATGHALEWTQSPDAIPNLGLGAPPHWFTVRLANTSPEDWSGLLEMSYTMIDVLDVYVAHGEDVIKVAEIGDQRPFSNRLLAHRNFLVPITVPAQESVRLIMLGESAGALKFPLDLWRMPAFFDHDQHALAPQILFAGIMLALVLYNFFLLLATRDWNYLWYVLSMVSVSFVVMSFHGILAQYAWPNIPALNNPVLVGAISVNIFSATIFAYSFLNLKRFASWVTLLFLGHSAAGALIFALNLFLPYAITIKLAALFSVTGATMGICTGVYLWYRGEILARFYTLAWFYCWQAASPSPSATWGSCPAI